MAYNLLSVSKVTKAGKRVKFYSNDCQILDWDDKVVAVGVRRGNLHYLSCQQVKDDQVHVSDARLNAESKEFIWHRRFGHLNERSLHTLASQRLVYDFDYNTSKQMPFCKSCVESKLHKTPFPSGGRKRAEVPLGLVHSDVCGPLGAELLSGVLGLLHQVPTKGLSHQLSADHMTRYFLSICCQYIDELLLKWQALEQYNAIRKVMNRMEWLKELTEP